MNKLRSTMASITAVALSVSLASAVMAQENDAPMEENDAPMELEGPEGTTWILEQQAVDGAAALEHLPQLILASLVMEDGQAGGNSGCNSWFADYELDGDSLTFGTVGSTMMNCPGPAMAVEQSFLANLGVVASWSSESESLVLSDADGTPVMLFAAAPEATVVGTWVATGINNGTGVETNAYTSTVTAVFDEEGRLSGIDGCNDYSTTYQVDGDAITIAPEIATTMMICEDPAIGDLSQQYYAALGNAAVWSVDAAGNLELRDDGGALQVGYAPAE